MRSLYFSVIPYLIVFMVQEASAKECTSLRIQNEPKNLNKLRGCTVIAGYLEIVLMVDLFNLSEWENEEGLPDDYSFPELTEITEYLMIYRVFKLTSLGKLFPNLRIIRGDSLFQDYSLIISHADNLTEIALTNLVSIQKGKVFLEDLRALCFARTIDWTIFGVSHVLYPNNLKRNCPKCPSNCNGLCWNSNTCQNLYHKNCHKECVHCTKLFSNEHCISCRNFDDSGKCVAKCPPDKYELKLRCVTFEQCSSYNSSTYYVFNNGTKECVPNCPVDYNSTITQITQNNISTTKRYCEYVGEKYVKVCPGGLIDLITTAETYKICTEIDGNLEIRSYNQTLTEEILEKNLGEIRIIRGHLQISRLDMLTSLKFFKKLHTIEGNRLLNKRYALSVFENKNLQELFDLKPGFKMHFGNNSTISFHDNPQLCLIKIEQLVNASTIEKDFRPQSFDVSQTSNGHMSSCIVVRLNVTLVNMTAYNVSLTWDGFEDPNKNVMSYIVFYSTDNGDEENEDVCMFTSWRSILVWETSVRIEDLTPFTTYKYYIKIQPMGLNENRIIGQTNISTFTTLSTSPSIIRQPEAKGDSSTSIRLQWVPPRESNGVLSYYNIIGYIHPDDPDYIKSRDFCLNPAVPLPLPVPKVKKIEEPKPLETNCTCGEPIITAMTGTMAKQCNSNQYSAFSEHFDAYANSCVDMFYNVTTKSISDMESEYSFTIKSRESISIPEKRDPVKKARVSEPQKFIHITTPGPNFTSFVVKNLEPFSVYIFYFALCNKEDQCSEVVMATSRTLKDPKYDLARIVDVKVKGQSVLITWEQPKLVNSIIVAYNIYYLQTNKENTKPVIDCVQPRKNYSINLEPGRYRIKVQAVSLAGPGNFSAPYEFNIEYPPDKYVWVSYTLIPTLLALFIIMIIVYIRWRMHNRFSRNQLIATINPDYEGVTYKADEWEINRSDIEIINEIGKGSFGMVYRGLIKSRGLKCAIKTITETSSPHDCDKFLNEATVMKSMNDAHHVVKLLGVVSIGTPPLVIMELMDRGDLKAYLRSSREPSQNQTSKECAKTRTYRMAIEIADGMAYLSAKKFVHRDLAARNCMVANDGTIKIGDFGMVRDIYETDYYRKETMGLLPVRWMAPESLADGVFTSDSDVWSYGIVLWEMATMAEQPYQGLSNEQVLHYVTSKHCLGRPPDCPDLLYEIMDACWRWQPIDRPQFETIVERLESEVGQDFKLVSFYHSREGEEYRANKLLRAENTAALYQTQTGRLESYWHYDANNERVQFITDNGEENEPFFPYQGKPSTPKILASTSLTSNYST